ncbi:MSCRAMM family adhesin SdrC [Cellulophaga sp. 20_2_10]|uniref:lipocalin family protein n=1 Tax=Cellulophaga sp. 20_2_10 TaxID=2942476 RepID=UPI00201A50A1|nr:lipocalin family protein [Cellulophaga sp. 20_2_10]MCL5245980.1 MSCRAMM family adhesin SdrC [Cellulophaga sp. 20_2_10]
MRKVISLFVFLVLLSSCNKDSQELFNLIEQSENTDTDNTDLDTDKDGISDDDENNDGTDPLKADTDNDGVDDGDEKKDGTNPLKADTDDDTVNDGTEKSDGTDPLKADSDEDNVNDGVEKNDGTDPLNADSDDDGLNDGKEKTNDTDPLDEDTDGDGVLDGTELTDNTDPTENCSFLLSSQTVTASNDWNILDCDNDGVDNITEVNAGTDPLVADEEVVKSPILGTWTLVSATIDNGTASTVVNNKTYPLEYTASSENENSEATFTDNPDKIVSSGEYNTVIQFNFLGTDYTETITSESPLSSGDWSINNNTLQLNSNEIVDGNYTIISLTETSLVLQTEVNRVIQTGGVDLDTKGTLVITMVKQQ